MCVTDIRCLQPLRQQLPCNLTVSQRQSCKQQSPPAQERFATASHRPAIQPSASSNARVVTWAHMAPLFLPLSHSSKVITRGPMSSGPGQKEAAG